MAHGFAVLLFAVCGSTLVAQNAVTVLGMTNAGTNPSVGVSMTLPAGAYRVDWVSGCYDDTSTNSWRADITCSFAGQTVVVPTATGASPPFASAGLCSGHYAGGCIHAQHGGGTAVFWIFDSGPGNNTNNPITLSIVPIPITGLMFAGAGSATTVGTPSLSPAGQPHAGNASFGWSATDLVPSSLSVLLLGTGNLSPGVTIHPAAPPTALLHVAPLGVTVVLLSDGSGNASYGWALPPNCVFAGLSITSQILDLDPALGFGLPIGTSMGMQFLIN